MHPDRHRRTQHLNELAEQGRWEEIYQRVALYEFGHETRMGFQLAFLRVLCTPHTARTLLDAGYIATDPAKRFYDTGLIVYEIIYNGLDSATGRRMIALMNRAHQRRDITDDQMTYVLCAFMVIPYRYIAWTGWRPLTDRDRHAAHAFYQRMGQLMNIGNIPASYTDAAHFLDSYEAHNVVTGNPDVHRLGTTFLQPLRRRLPKPAKPFAAVLFTTFINDRRIATALGYRPLPRWAQTIVRAFGRLYGQIQRRTAPPDKPVFTPGNKAGTVYPHGYTLDQLGPARARPSTRDRPDSNN